MGNEHDTTASPFVPLGVRFRPAGQVRAITSGALVLAPGDAVIVDTESGTALGEITRAPQAHRRDDTPAPPYRVVKKADARDVARDEANRLREREAQQICLQRIRERQMPMKLIGAECPFDGSRISFYFSSEERVDFRDLVRELAHTLHTRVDMKQIGARDETKVIGAVGPCGRELCCSSWLTEFHTVSVKMAKEQGLSLNPSKLAGMCGRLKCCLRYEYDTYRELGRNLPRIGSTVVSVQGDGVVTHQNILKQTVTIRREDGSPAEATLDDLVTKKSE